MRAGTPVLELADAAAAAHWLRARCRGALRSDSRQVRAGDAFLAWPGAARDGRGFVAQALAAGASGCLVEAEGLDELTLDGDHVVALRGLKACAGEVADAWHGHPSRRLAVLAVTGTNGKTSTAWWLAQALGLCGQRAGVIGTLGVGVPPDVVSTGLTTPDPVTLQTAFSDYLARGFAACAIEASSIGIVEHRLAGTQVRVALFTNFTQDHLDYHGDMASYWAAKRRLFSWPGLQHVVINVDDPQGARLCAELQAEPSAPTVWSVSARAPATLRAADVRYVDGTLAFEVIESDQAISLRSALIGEFNVHNLLLVLGGLRAMGISLARAVEAVPQLLPVPGRLQRVPGAASGQPAVVVDYAHTPDALDKVLQALRPWAQERGGALWCVFGCGGDRDPGKRPQMGRLAALGADHVVVTSDNPRSESPSAIIEQVSAGVPAERMMVVRHIADRRDAIAEAVALAASADVVLIAGKGHEDYQEVAGQRLPFSDAQEAHRALERRA
jgi:UDP-N-acetylmuramyl-tripeptide synthetase